MAQHRKFLTGPFAGARMLRDLLRLEALHRRPSSFKCHPAHPVLPYLLRDLKITRPSHVLAMDITNIPMKRGFVYLAPLIDCKRPAIRKRPAIPS